MPLYQGPVVDAHQHFWDPSVNDHPWLRPEVTIPFRYGNYDAIKRRYLPPDYWEDARGQNVQQTVYVETEWNPSDPIGETRYASGLAAQFGVPDAIVAQAWLDRPDVAEVLSVESGFPLVRSVRHKPGGPATPGQGGHTLMSDESWRRGYALLERHGLHFDLQTPWWNLGEATMLARDFPATTVILNHTGLPSDRSEAGLAGWRRAMAAFAQQPNVRVKISGLGQPGQPWSVATNGWIVRETISIFRPERCMFGSNFPVDSLCASFASIFHGFREIVQDMPVDAQIRLFRDTAREVYRLE
ncbi:MAG: amidohydrolase family protein [Acetobacteraceae bacterium]|nr:amidohydrolase family protein [Acetobacteraceae bacterium]